MAILVIDNMPASLFDRIQRLARTQHRTPSDTALDVLESALADETRTHSEAPLPQAPFLTEEICAPVEIPWPEGEIVVPIELADYLPEPHDIPVME